MDKTIYGKNFEIRDLDHEPGKPHLIINARVAKHDESGWMTYYVKQDVAIPLETVYEIVTALGIEYKKQF